MKNSNFHFSVMVSVLKTLGHELIATNLEELYRGIYKTPRKTKKKAIKKVFNSLITIFDHTSPPRVIYMTEEDDWVEILSSSKIKNLVRYSDAEIKLSIYCKDLRLEMSTFWDRSCVSTVGRIPYPRNVYTEIKITFFSKTFENAEKGKNKLECLIPWY